MQNFQKEEERDMVEQENKERLRSETNEINLSLTFLEQVIIALKESKPHIP